LWKRLCSSLDDDDDDDDDDSLVLGLIILASHGLLAYIICYKLSLYYGNKWQ